MLKSHLPLRAHYHSSLEQCHSSTTLVECVSTPLASLHSSPIKEQKLHLLLSEARPSVVFSCDQTLPRRRPSELSTHSFLSGIKWSPSDFPSNLLFFDLFEAGVAADIRYSGHPADVAEAADSRTPRLQHCDCQSRLSQACCEGSASFSDCKSFFQPYGNSSEPSLLRRPFFSLSNKVIYALYGIFLNHFVYMHIYCDALFLRAPAIKWKAPFKNPKTLCQPWSL